MSLLDARAEHLAAAPTGRRRWLVPAAGLLGLGAVTVALSELVFWGQPGRALGDPLGLLPTLVAYTVAVVAVVGLVERAWAATPSGLLLAGALLGWVVEGVVVTTAYEALPFSLLWTGVAWHALVSVVLGWALLPRWLASGRRGLVPIAAVGAAWGAWGAFMAQDSGEAAPVAAFAVYAVVVATVLVGGTLVWTRCRGRRLVSPWVWRVALALVAAGFVVRVITFPWALVLVPCVALLAWTATRRPGGARPLWLGPVPTTRQVVIGAAVLVACAATTYGLLLGTPLAVGVGPVVVIVSCALGAGWLLVTLVGTRRSRASAGT